MRLYKAIRYSFTIAPWLVELINPPPRDTLTIPQKVGRVLLVTLTLLTLCVISALVLAICFFVIQRSGEMLAGIPQLLNALTILTVSILVNIVCVWTLFQIKRLDRQLIPPRDLTDDASAASGSDSAGSSKI